MHYGLHLLAPALIAKWYRPNNWKNSYFILIGTMLVDLDHLLADPIYDPTRLSVGHHLLHSYTAIIIYAFLLIPKKSRLIAIGLLFHMLTDYIDYQLI